MRKHFAGLLTDEGTPNELVYVAPAHFRQAELYERLDKRRQAVEHYRGTAGYQGRRYLRGGNSGDRARTPMSRHNTPGADAVRREYASLASTYEDRWARYVASTTTRTLEHLAAEPGETLLDLGCGTGALLRTVAAGPAAPSLLGIDVSLPMLQRARAKLESDVALVVADAAALPVDSGSIHVVVSVSSFHYWTDPAGGLREIGRVLRPGGRLVITDWCDDFLGCKLFDRWLRLTRRAYQRIYGVKECTTLLAQAGFRLQGLERYKVSWLWGMMTVVATRSAV